MQEKFIISPEIYEKCAEFANNSVSSSIDKYAKRNQFDVEKIKRDIMVGKIAEFGVYNFLLNQFPNLSKPDTNIYDKNNKTWDPDLKDEASGISIAVKSQDLRSRVEFEESWVFQGGTTKKFDSDVGVFKNIDDKHYVAFVSLNVPKRTGEVRAIVKIQWLHDNNLFKEMKKENLKNNKSAVYFEDLERYNDQLMANITEEQKIISTVKVALQKYGPQYLIEFETSNGFNSSYKERFRINFLNTFNFPVNADQDNKNEFMDYWILRIPSNNSLFWKSWLEFERKFKLKAFW